MNAKLHARRLRAALNAVTGHALPHMQLLEVTARTFGYRDWHELERRTAPPVSTPVPHLTVSLNWHQDDRNPWPRADLKVVYALDQRADAEGIARVNAIEFGEWVSSEPNLHPSKAYARGQQWLLMVGNTSLIDVLASARKHREDHVIRVNRTLLYPARERHASVNLPVQSVPALAAAGDALHFYLWLLARSAAREDAVAVYADGDYGPQEGQHLAHLETLGWASAQRNVSVTHVTLGAVRTVEGPF